MVIYSGPSEITGQPIVACATGLRRKSRNRKTGDMIQVWVLPARSDPITAARTGLDSAVCNGCPLRGVVRRVGTRRENINRACYVDLSKAPLTVWDKWRRGGYPSLDVSVFAGRRIRMGAYGDPVAVPYVVWRDLLAKSSGWTGYTHSWRTGRFWRFRRWLMASVETEADTQLAHRRGWRTFRTSVDGQPVRGEVRCLYPRLTCAECMICDGSHRGAGKTSVVTAVHGIASMRQSYVKLTTGLEAN